MPGRGVSRRSANASGLARSDPDWIEKDIQATELDKETRMSHERDAALTIFQPSWRSVLENGRQHAGPSRGSSAKLRAEHIGQPTILVFAPWIEETCSVEVVANGPLVIGVGLCGRAARQNARCKSGKSSNEGAARRHDALPSGDSSDCAPVSPMVSQTGEVGFGLPGSRASPSFIVICGA